MRRRDALAAGLALSLPLSAGCLETLRREDAWRELVVDPPEGVYVPSKVDGMASYGTATADGRTVSLAATRPHSFWTVTGTDRVRADVRDYHSIHLMASVRDAETGTVVPASVTTAIRNRDEPVDERTLWPMLSQRMGFHHGDNVPLDGDGSYVVSVRIEPTSAAVVGSLDDRLETATTVDLEFDYVADEIEGLERRLIDADEGRGEAGAVEPMSGSDEGDRDRGENENRDRGENLESVVDSRIGSTTSGDLEFTLGVLDEDDAGDAVLAVVPRTRYNRYPVPFASLSVVVRRGGMAGDGVPLRERLDAELGHHYGTSIERDPLEAADELTVAVDAPPQVSRHEGYETAFLDLEPATIDLE